MHDQAVLVGVMSGTSLDGATAAIARFSKTDANFTAELLGIETIPYDDALRERIGVCANGASAADYNALAFRLGHVFADVAAQVIASAGVARGDIAAICSHGHTLWHAPPAGTWQLGEGAVIAERLGIDVIEDFRVRDVAAGGQGAPLVTIADALLFGADGAARALQNIGGMANVTIVPGRGSIAGVRAFDTGPGVAIIDALTLMLVGDRFDLDGNYARLGKPVAAVLNQLLDGEFFRREPPRSTGRETFGDAYALAVLEGCRTAEPECIDADIIATATELTAASIVAAYDRFIPEPIADVLFSGGGARNVYLRERIATRFAASETHSGVALADFGDAFFPGEAKEAVAFAFLGFLHLRGEPAIVPGATGARGARVLGKRVPA